ncbi:glpC [Acrasis kona]|uniref:GlpC n=2 Tax=Acrasis kona TaxID=1008807 RepID=A0AAW2YIV5_9EUKA
MQNEIRKNKQHTKCEDEHSNYFIGKPCNIDTNTNLPSDPTSSEVRDWYRSKYSHLPRNNSVYEYERVCVTDKEDGAGHIIVSSRYERLNSTVGNCVYFIDDDDERGWGYVLNMYYTEIKSVKTSVAVIEVFNCIGESFDADGYVLDPDRKFLQVVPVHALKEHCTFIYSDSESELLLLDNKKVQKYIIVK